MGLLEEAPAPPHPIGQRPKKRALGLARAGVSAERLELRNRFAALCESGTACECPETHALFEETLEPE
eukprot:14338310-Alexandrium_andersonii.AAC.1